MTDGGDPLLVVRSATPAPDLEGLYVAHHRRLRSLAASITFDRSIADEIVHDAFAALTPRLTGVRDAEAYLQRSVVNLAITHVRRRELARRLPAHRVEHTSIGGHHVHGGQLGSAGCPATAEAGAAWWGTSPGSEGAVSGGAADCSSREREVVGV
jgi:DNA-directed RNA polymerase specialized sigma24 family protein